MDSKIDLLEFIKGFLWQNFWHIDVVAYFLIGLSMFFVFFWFISVSTHKLSTTSKFAPSIMTAAGLLGTFIGLTIGLKDLNLQDQASMQELIDSLKLVFVYSLIGVFSAISFMLLNLIPTFLQTKKHKEILDKTKQDAKTHNQTLLIFQKTQAQFLEQLLKQQAEQSSLLELSLNSQQAMQQNIAKLQFDNDNQQLSELISIGVVRGLQPLLFEIKTAVADQGTEAIKKVLEDLKAEVLVPMKTALDQTNKALGTTNQAVKDSIAAIKESQKHNNLVISAVDETAKRMEKASEKMNVLVDKIDTTVQHMHTIQKEQTDSLNQFNTDLHKNLNQIQPAIERGLQTASDSLTSAIGTAAVLMEKSINNAACNMQENIKTTSTEMVNNIHKALEEAGYTLQNSVIKATTELNHSVSKTIEKQNESINESFKQFDAIQTKFDMILKDFSGRMDTHITNMATTLKSIGENAERMINSASNNLRNTLGDIDTKLLNTTVVLEKSLEVFREQYQTSLTEYLNQQTTNLNGFLDRQNEQLEKTIGEQREGLVAVTNNLTEQFVFMDEKQRDVNTEIYNLISRIEAVQESIIPKVQEIAFSLKHGEDLLSRELSQSAKHLTTISSALENMGDKLPTEFENAFILLNSKYEEAFKDLDHGLKHAVNNLGGAITALAAVIPLHDAMNQR